MIDDFGNQVSKSLPPGTGKMTFYDFILLDFLNGEDDAQLRRG
jgi:hypothetical protein